MASADRPYQIQSIESLRQGFREHHTRQVLAAPTGAGKCLGRGTPVLLFDGTVKPAENIQVGDILMGPDSTPRNVLSTTGGFGPLFRVTPSKGDPYIVNDAHILSLAMTSGATKWDCSKSDMYRAGKIHNISVTDYLSRSKTFKHCAKGWRVGVDFKQHSSLLIPPYFMGAWLGDGNSSGPAITSADVEIINAVSEIAEANGMNVRIEKKPGNKAVTAHVTGGMRGRGADNPVRTSLADMGLIGNKHIPHSYLTASRTDRLELLAGLLDTDGSLSNGGFDFIQKDERLARETAFLARSLGFAAYLTPTRKECVNNGVFGDYWRISISGDCSVIPVRLERKKAPVRSMKKDVLRVGISVDSIGEGEYFGFEIDGDRLFLLGDFTVTHNSVIMMDMIKSAIAKGSRICFICERRILVEQFSRHLDAQRIDHGIMMAKHWRFKPQELVQIATAQTLEKMESWPVFDICFVDEIHACMRTSIKNMMTVFPKLKVVGATATPFHPELAKYFSRVTSVISMRELVEHEDKFLVPFRVFVAHEIDTEGLKLVAGEWKKDDLEKRGQQIVGDVVADYIRISNEVFGGYRKTICFSCGVAHGADLAKKFNEAGVNAVQISANDEDEYRADVLADFAKPDSDIKVVISVSILSRGFDQTDVEHVILARPLKKSFSEHVQMIGRGARSHPDKATLDKKFAVIQDNSGNWLRFQESWDDFYSNGVHELTGEQDKKPRKEPTKAEKEAAKCPRCGHVWTGDVCIHCGAMRERRNAVMAVAGEMTELSLVPKKEKYSADYKQDFYAQLIGWTVEHGKKPGMAFYKYQEKFGVQPSMAKPAAVPPGPEVLAWIKSRNIAWAKSQHRRAA